MKSILTYIFPLHSWVSIVCVTKAMVYVQAEEGLQWCEKGGADEPGLGCHQVALRRLTLLMDSLMSKGQHCSFPAHMDSWRPCAVCIDGA